MSALSFRSLRSLRFARVAVIAMTLLLAVLVGALTPSLTYAAPPAQTPTGAADLAQTVSAFLDLLMALLIGGAVAYVLQMIPAWRNWSPTQFPFAKPLVVLVFTALLGGALSSLKVIATAELFAHAPDWARAFVGFVVVFVGSQLTYQKGFSPQWARVGVVLAVLLLGGALVLASAPTANAESPAADRLAQEPALYCVALEVGLPADAVALAKVKFDTRYGFAHGIASDAQWSATWGERMQYFTDWLGVPNPTNDGTLKSWCARLVAAQARILEP